MWSRLHRIPLLFHTLLLLLSASFPSVTSYDVPTFPSAVKLSYATDPIVDGQHVPPTLVMVPPDLIWSEASMMDLYTVAMVDPDAPSPGNPVNALWLHYLHVNLKGQHLMGQLKFAPSNTSAPPSIVLAAYAPPTPPQGSGRHRYVVSVYRQSRGIEGLSAADAVMTREDSRRAKWDVDR